MPGVSIRGLTKRYGDVAVVEGLDLRSVEPGWYDLICLPLLIPGSDGGPARAIVPRWPASEGSI